MGIVVDPFLLDYLNDHAGYCTVVLKDAGDGGAARRALEAARAALMSLDLPDRPGERAVPWASGVASHPGGLQFSFEASAAQERPGLAQRLLDTIVAALADARPGVVLLTHPPTTAVRLETATGPSPDASDHPALPAGWPLDIPLPDPRQEIYSSSSPGACSRAFMVPHQAEALMAFFEEALPRQGYPVIVSVDLVEPDTEYVGRVFFRQGDMTGQVAVTHATHARHVEISLCADLGEIRSMLAGLGDEPLPPGVRLRVDNRRAAG